MLIEEIATASASQSTAIAEVSTVVRQMDEMTQHNAALVEETNAAIEQTETQAVELDRVVAVFKLEQAEPVRAVPFAAPQTRAAPAKSRYLSQGNAAVSEDWSEF